MKKIIFSLFVLASAVFGFESAEQIGNAIIIKTDGFVSAVFNRSDIAYIASDANRNYSIVFKYPNSLPVITKDKQVVEFIANSFIQQR